MAQYTDVIRSRFWGYVGNQLTQYGNLSSLSRLETSGAPAEKLSEYIIRWAYYENKRLYGLLKSLGLATVEMPAEWNPVPAVVQFFVANVFGETPAIQSENEAVVEAVRQVWEWSNFDALKGDLTETAVVLSDVFLKVAEKWDAAAPEAGVTAVYMQDIPPETVRYKMSDERGYLRSVRIDTPRQESVFSGERKRHVLVEIWNKAFDDGSGGVRFYEVPAGRSIDDERLPPPVMVRTFNELGYDFIPVVWAAVPTVWWSYTDQIDRYNALALKLDRLNRPTGVIHGRHTDEDGRPMPAPRVNTEEVETTYQEAADGTFGWIRVPGNSQFDWASSPIDLAAAMRQMVETRDGVESSLPEYRVATLDASQIAAETMEMLLNQAGQRVLDVRGVLERALERAQMMALSIGQLAELPGFEANAIGTWENDGIHHTFVQRGVFKLSGRIMAMQLKELRTAGVPLELAMKIVGYEDGVIEGLAEALAAESLRERTTLAAVFARQQAAFDSGAADNGMTQI